MLDRLLNPLKIIVISSSGLSPVLVQIKSFRNVYPEDVSTISVFTRDMKVSAAYCLSRDSIEKEINKVKILPWQKGISEILEIGNG